MLSGSMPSGSFFQLAKYIMARLEKQLIPWNGLEKALLTAPHIFQHYAVQLVARSSSGSNSTGRLARGSNTANLLAGLSHR